MNDGVHTCKDKTCERFTTLGMYIAGALWYVYNMGWRITTVSTLPAYCNHTMSIACLRHSHASWCLHQGSSNHNHCNVTVKPNEGNMVATLVAQDSEIITKKCTFEFIMLFVKNSFVPQRCFVRTNCCVVKGHALCTVILKCIHIPLHANAAEGSL